MKISGRNHRSMGNQGMIFRFKGGGVMSRQDERNLIAEWRGWGKYNSIAFEKPSWYAKDPSPKRNFVMYCSDFKPDEDIGQAMECDVEIKKKLGRYLIYVHGQGQHFATYTNSVPHGLDRFPRNFTCEATPALAIFRAILEVINGWQ